MAIDKFIIFRFLFCFLIYFAVSNGFSQTSADYLILEDPFEQRIYNKYEQNLTFNDSAIILKYCPIEILAYDTLLSDNYTSCYIGKIDNHTYYFVNPSKVFPINKIYNSYSKIYSDVYILKDSIIVTIDNTIRFTEPQGKNNPSYVPEGTRLYRVFKSGSLTYVKSLNYPTQYGWCNLSKNEGWEVLKTQRGYSKSKAEEIEDVLIKKIAETNSLIYKLFSKFNSINQKYFQPPNWSLINSKNEFVCTLMNSDQNFSFKESSRILAEEIQLAIAYSGYQVKLINNQIIISSNDQSREISN